MSEKITMSSTFGRHLRLYQANAIREVSETGMRELRKYIAADLTTTRLLKAEFVAPITQEQRENLNHMRHLWCLMGSHPIVHAALFDTPARQPILKPMVSAVRLTLVRDWKGMML
jgi:hypothetical protein